MTTGLEWARAGLARGQIRLTERDQAIQHAEDMMFTYAVRKGLLEGQPESGLPERLPHIAAQAASKVLRHSRKRAVRKIGKTKDRLRLTTRE